jgi:magnesium transporter
MITARILANGELREAPVEEALECADGSIAWIDIVGRDEGHLGPVAEKLGLHPLAVEDALSSHQRPKLDDYGSHLFLVFYGLGSTPEEDDDEEFDVFIAPQFIVTVREGTTTSLEPVLRRLKGVHPDDVRTGWLAWAVLDEVVDNYFNVVDAIEDDIDDLEEHVFVQPRPSDVQQRIFRARKQLVRLRRRVTPMRDMLSALIARAELSVGVVPYLQDVYDHVLRITDTVDTFRDLVSSAHDSYLTEVSNDMNRVMKRFTSIGAILVVTTLIAGIYGMNFEHMPELHWVYGYPMALGLMVGSTLLLLWYFRHKDWL